VAKTRTEGLAAWKRKVLQRYPQAARDQIRQANERSADDYAGLLRRIIARGDPKDGHLVDTIRKDASEASEVGFSVSIGDAAHPYPLHLETGHRAADGTHVPAKPAIFPARRVVAKRHKGRVARASSKAVKIVTGGA
jgi:hypothetical protein